MQSLIPVPATPPRPVPDAQIIAEVQAGDIGAFELLMRRYNQLVFRSVRSIVRSDAEAEDVAQEAWLAAYQHLDQFQGRAAFATWVTRIAIRRAMARSRQQRRWTPLDELGEGSLLSDDDETPASVLQRREVARFVEQVIDALPVEYRLVLMLRDVEQLSTREAAESLGLTEENVRVRLHRARAAMRDRLEAELGGSMQDAFGFDGSRCDRIVSEVLAQLRRSAMPRM